MRKTFIFLLLTFLIPLSGSGCWDIKDASNTAFATAVGLDTAADQPNSYLVTFEFVNPAGLKKNSTTTPTCIIKTVKASSIGQAIEQMQTQISRKISLSHLRVIIIGEKLAKSKKFRDLANFFQREADIALRLKLMFAMNIQASELLKTQPNFEKTVSEELVALTQIKDVLSLARTNSFYNFIGDLRATQGTALGARILTSDNKKNLVYSGSAVFQNWKLVDWLSGQETQELNWLTDKVNANLVSKMNNGIYTYMVDQHFARIIPVVGNESLEFLVKVKTKGNLVEEQIQHLDLSKPKNLDQLEKAFSQSITEQIEAIITKSQKEMGIDFLGFGKALKKYHPEIYQSLDWEEIFPDIPIIVEVKASIHRFGLQE